MKMKKISVLFLSLILLVCSADPIRADETSDLNISAEEILPVENSGSDELSSSYIKESEELSTADPENDGKTEGILYEDGRKVTDEDESSVSYEELPDSDISTPVISDDVCENEEFQESVNAASVSYADGYYYIVSGLDTSMGLEVEGGVKDCGAGVRNYRRNGSAGQVFYIRNEGNGFYSFRNLNSGLYLNAEGGNVKNGTRLVQYSSDLTGACLFSLEQTDSDSFVTIRAKNSSCVLSVENDSAAAGADVCLTYGNSISSQMWKLLETDENGTMAYPTALYNKMIASLSPSINENVSVAVPGATYSEGVRLSLMAYTAEDYQKWQLTITDDGYYIIMNVKTGLVMTAKAYGGSSWGAVSGTTVIQYNEIEEEYYKQYQKWTIKEAGDGAYYLINKATGLYLDLDGSYASENTCLKVTDQPGRTSLFTFTETTTDAYLRWNAYETDSAGDRHWLEGTYWDDPKVSDTEFFASSIYTEGGSQGKAGMMMIGYSMLNRIDLSNMRYNIYAFGQYEICRTGTLTKVLTAIASGYTSPYDSLPLAIAAANACVNGEPVVLEDSAVITTPNSSNTYGSGTTLSRDTFSIYDGFMTPGAFARHGFTTEGHHTCLYKGHIYYVTSEIWV